MRGIGGERLARLQENAANIRNICILAHVDHGELDLDGVGHFWSLVGNNLWKTWKMERLFIVNKNYYLLGLHNYMYAVFHYSD